MFVEAAKEFNSHTRRSDGEQVASSLNGGLALLQDALYSRLHDDVERFVGRDSMLMPVSELKTRQATRAEIALYQIAESDATAKTLGQHGLGPADDWYWRWLARLRLGESHADPSAIARVTGYLAKTPRGRQLAFTDVLTRVLPEARQAPLVLFNLYPFSVQIVTASAFGDQPGAAMLRRQQVDHQPAIADCHACRGQVLENGEQCPECGNPLWKHEWLVAE
jgi:hypothetical protein